MLRIGMKHTIVSLNTANLHVDNSPIPGHCLEHIRQYIMYAGGSDTPTCETFAYTKYSDAAMYVLSNGPHICRNFRKLQD